MHMSWAMAMGLRDYVLDVKYILHCVILSLTLDRREKWRFQEKAVIYGVYYVLCTPYALLYLHANI